MKGYGFPLFLVFSLLLGCNRADKLSTADPLTVQSAAPQLLEESAPQAKMHAVADLSNEAGQAPVATTPQTANTPSDKKIIRSGNIAVESKEIKKSKKALDALIARYAGYYEQETLSSSGNYSNYSLVVRIPAEQLDHFLNDIEKGGDKLTERSIRSEDVSLQYFDTESRLKSKRAYLERYQQMVAQAKSVKDLLEIQEQIRQLQEDIDSQESIMRSLKDQIGYSSLSIQLFEYQANLPNGSQSFWIQLKDALVDGWALVGEIVLTILRFWPVILLLAVAIFAWRKRKRYKK